MSWFRKTEYYEEGDYIVEREVVRDKWWRREWQAIKASWQQDPYDLIFMGIGGIGLIYGFVIWPLWQFYKIFFR